jgi:hypothetical protein
LGHPPAGFADIDATGFADVDATGFADIDIVQKNFERGPA